MLLNLNLNLKLNQIPSRRQRFCYWVTQYMCQDAQTLYVFIDLAYC